MCARHRLLLPVALLCLSACTTTPAGETWPAAIQRAAGPQTWVPLAGAALVAAADWDGEVSDWAVEHTPVFGSTAGADTGADLLIAAGGAAYGGTALAGGQVEPVRRLRTDGVGLLAAGATTVGLKQLSDRRRPNDSDARSFPSLHATVGAGLATLSENNLAALDLTAGQRTGSRIGVWSLAAATGWARIESGHHYPSDVLVGAALGHFFGALFVPEPHDDRPRNGFGLAVSRRGTVGFGLGGTF